tara:strand:- start:991 stop:1143 length:153 start_codon:yes stop_codon:yes gene_type:complete
LQRSQTNLKVNEKKYKATKKEKIHEKLLAMALKGALGNSMRFMKYTWQSR